MTVRFNVEERIAIVCVTVLAVIVFALLWRVVLR